MKIVRMGGLAGLYLMALVVSAQAGAALHLSSAQAGMVYDLQGQTVTCRPGQEVGIYVTGTNVVVQNATIMQCAIPVRDQGVGTTLRNLVAPQAVSVGFDLGGCCGQVESNFASGVDIGFHVRGSSYTLLNNVSHANRVGILIVGHGGHYEGNHALDNTEAGIYIGAHTSVVRQTQALLGLTQKGVSNVLIGNEALGNGVDVAEDPADECNENLWQENIYVTSSLPAPCVVEPDVVSVLP